jgi:pyruvate dehydrogenase E2 component (dihydrolipoamide acetyltransferase)
VQVFHRAEKAKYPCTVTDVIALACARIMVGFPAFRSRISGEDLIEIPGANIGLAVGMEDGLRVPVLVGAERMSLRQLAEQTRRISEAARQGKVEAMGQGAFTISNLGMYGVEEFTAIINPPEAAILAVGAIRESVIVKDGALRAGRVMTLTLSADHRIIDGLVASAFLGRLKEMLEAPESLGQ